MIKCPDYFHSMIDIYQGSIIKKGLYEPFFLYFCTTLIKHIVPWCNGSTADFGSACPGSSPGGTAKELKIKRLIFYLNNSLIIILFDFSKINF